MAGRFVVRAVPLDGGLLRARTIADLEGAASIQQAHVTEAIQYRTLDRRTG